MALRGSSSSPPQQRRSGAGGLPQAYAGRHARRSRPPPLDGRRPPHGLVEGRDGAHTGGPGLGDEVGFGEVQT